MGSEKRDLDYAMVPAGVLVMSAYHAWLLHRIISHPTTTVVGINAITRRAWVDTMMADPGKNGVLAVQTMRNNIMASTVLASTAIALCSLIAILAGNNDLQATIAFGHRSAAGSSVKYCTVLICFFMAFMCSVQSIRYYSHVSILINVNAGNHLQGNSANYVSGALNRGSYFWSLGLRAFYFSFPLLLWTLGPIPMLVSCCMMVFLLYFLDVPPTESRDMFSAKTSDLLHVQVEEEGLSQEPIAKSA